MDSETLIKAIQANRPEVVEWLILKEGGNIDPSINNNYSIRLASCNGHVEVVKVLLNDSRVDPAANNNQAIQMATKNGHTEVVKLLKEFKQKQDNKLIKIAEKLRWNKYNQLLKETDYKEIKCYDLFRDDQMSEETKTLEIKYNSVESIIFKNDKTMVVTYKL